MLIACPVKLKEQGTTRRAVIRVFAVPTGLALLLICLFGRESRGRDLRELDARTSHMGEVP